MKITAKQSRYFKFLFEFDYDADIVEFCREIKRKYGFEKFNFVKQGEIIGWGFNDKTIFDEIIKQYPEIEVEIDVNELDKNPLKVIRNKPIKKLNSDFETNTKIPLYKFQKEGVDFIMKTNGNCMLADQMGLGKTNMAITYSHLKNFKTLVICPASVKLVWQDEVNKFTNRKAVVLYADKLNENIDDADFVIMNYEIVDKALQNGIDFEQFDCLVCDESTYIKNPSAQRSRAVKQLFFIPHKILLTGTPILNRPAELWNQLNLINPLLFPSRWKFFSRYCNLTRTRFGWDYTGHSNLAELKEKLDGLVLRRLKKDVLQELPPKIETLIRVELSKEERKKYNKFYNDFEAIIDDGNRAVQLARLTYLKQFLSAVKLKNAIEIIDNIIESDEKVVLFSQYLDPLHALKKGLGDIAVVFEGKMSEEEKHKAIEQFQNNDKVKVFLGSVMASGLGISLTEAPTAIFLDLPWQPATIAQAMDRIHRIGQNKQVNIYYLVAQNTIENQIYDLISEKVMVINQLIDENKVISDYKESVFEEFMKQVRNKKNSH